MTTDSLNNKYRGMLTEIEIAEFTGLSPTIDIPALFGGWGGENSEIAIFKCSPEYFEDKTLLLIVDDKRVAEANTNTQSEIGSGFQLRGVFDNKDGRYVLVYKLDRSLVKPFIRFGNQNKTTDDNGLKYCIALKSRGEFNVEIYSVVGEIGKMTHIYFKSFSCK